jgi:hypothetical protein
LAKGGFKMNREEILEKSRQENRGQDIANLEVSRSSIVFGWIVAICLLAVVAVTEAIKYDRMNSGIFFAVMAGCSAIFIRKYLKLHKKHELYISIVYVIAAAAFFVSWILQLTK